MKNQIQPLLLLLSVQAILLESSAFGSDSTDGIFFVEQWGIHSTNTASQNDEAKTNILNAWLETGGIVRFPAGVFKFNAAWAIPNNGGQHPTQPPMILEGVGGLFSGQSHSPLGGTIIDIVASGSPAKLYSGGLGSLTVRHITFQNTESCGANIPFMKFTFTTPFIRDVGFYGSGSGALASNDGIILGSQSDDFNSGGINAAFQGYGGVIERCYFNRIRIAVDVNRHVNGYVIQNNTIWNQSGGSYPPIFLHEDGGAIAGCLIQGNLITMTSYASVGIGASGTNIVGNSFIANNYFDPQPGQFAYGFTNASDNTIFGGLTIGYQMDDLYQSGIARNNFFSSSLGRTNIIGNAWRFTGDAEFRPPGSTYFRFYDSVGDHVYRSVTQTGYAEYYQPATNSTPERMILFIRDDNASHVLVALGGTNRTDLATAGDFRIFGAAGGTITLGGPFINNVIVTGRMTANGGLSPPAITMEQRDSIASPVGLIIYQTDNTPGLRMRTASGWVRFTETADP